MRLPVQSNRSQFGIPATAACSHLNEFIAVDGIYNNAYKGSSRTIEIRCPGAARVH